MPDGMTPPVGMTAPADGATTRRVSLPMQTRAATVQTVDEEKRTVDLVWSTGASVTRRDYWTGERYVETLSLDPAHVDLTRLNNGAPLLNTHSQWGLGDILGVVESAAADGTQGTATVRFSTRPDVEPFWQDVRGGIIRNVSVGYLVRKYEVTRGEGGSEIRLAVDWEPLELSMVPVPADAGAGTRSANTASTYPCDLTNRATPAPNTSETNRMDTVQTAGSEPVTESRSAVTVDADAIRTAERQRVAHIGTVARRHSLGDDFVARHVEAGSAAETVNAAALDALAARSAGSEISTIRVGASGDDPAAIRSAMADAIVARATYAAPATEHARSFMSHSILDMAGELAGIRSRNRDEVLRRALSTSDFPMLLENAANKVLLGSYGQATPTYRSIAKRRDFSDFKVHKFLRSGDFPTLLEYGETGEIQEGAISEGRESITLASYGRVVNLSRRVLVNDDLGAFSDLVGMAGRRIADFENATFWAMVAANSGAGPTMADTNAVFHSSHGNVAASGTAIDVANVGKGRAAMRKQTSLDGLKLNLAPKFIVTGADKELEAEQLIATVQPQSAANVNPFSGRLTALGDANITGNAWYLFADPAVAEVFVFGYLAGAPGPRFLTEEGFRTDGVALRLTLDFGCGAVDYRGGYRNAGA